MQHKTFLGEVARKLLDRYPNDISNLTLVFPSQRARLFFSKELSQLIDKPIWQPHYISMDDIMCHYSSFRQGEKLRLIAELYKIYVTHHPSESFDKFYFWGEMLLSDFDLIDKYLINADMLFRNLCDLKELEADLSYLTPEMRKVISSFWGHFSEEESLTDEKRKFLNIWLSLAPIYKSYTDRLKELRFAYSGMIYRSAVENIESQESPTDLCQHYVFIGFNALCECEKRVIRYLSNKCQCDFYWDYDSFYTADKEHEAGRFLRENITKHIATDDISHDNMLSINKKISSISCVSNVVQCKYVNTLLREISPDLKFDKSTAIVLTNESLLVPLLHSLPAEISENINVTMGYALRQTTAYSFIERLIELQKNSRKTPSEITFYHADATGILSHPYINGILKELSQKLHRKIIDGRYIRVDNSLFTENDILSHIFSYTDDYIALSKYLLDVLYVVGEALEQSETHTLELSYISLIADNITQLNNNIKECDIKITTSTYASLLRRHLQSIRIPFSGEPLKGLQVMGILETRNIDFRNVIILSMNDDNFPGDMSNSSSFIPYNLRAAYGIPTPEHHEGVYAYYFYRLIQRAERIDMLYCSHADDKSTGEQSRYIYQLEYESPYSIDYRNVGVDAYAEQPTDGEVAKCGDVRNELERFTLNSKNAKKLSPSAFANYIACPMKFYFSSIARLKESEQLNEQIDAAMLGTILHASMQELYSSIKNIANPASHLEQMLRGDKIERMVEQAINDKYLNKPDADIVSYTGNLMLIKEIISKYIRHGIIPHDIRNNGFAVMGVEEDIDYDFPLGDGREVHIGGVADRIDSMDNGALRVIDYKTGKEHKEFGSIEEFFEGEKRTERANILQTMIYSMILHHKHHRNVYPSLYYARVINKPEYTPRIIHSVSSTEKIMIDYQSYADDFEALLTQKLNELFDYNTPFRCCNDEDGKTCKYCDFKKICKR